MRISAWSSDVCSSDLPPVGYHQPSLDRCQPGTRSQRQGDLSSTSQVNQSINRGPKMKHSIFAIVAGSILLLAAAPGAYAQQTTAGLKVQNNATVSYKVSGVTQTQPAPGSVTFTVDRKVVLSVTELGNAVTSVAPSATNQALAFTVTNGSNDFIDIALVASDAAAATFKGGDGSLTELGHQVNPDERRVGKEGVRPWRARW